MTPSHHPDPATLMSYAAGSLVPALAAVVAAHLWLCGRCRRELRLLDALGGALLAGLDQRSLAGPPPPPVAGRGDRGRQAPMESGAPGVEHADVPAPLARLIGASLDQVRWAPLAPGIRQHVITLPGSAPGIIRLIRAEPGRTIPEHGHDGAELTLVLRGAYRDAVGEFRPGDVADLDEATDHEPVADPADGCICLVASEHPPRFRGLLPRLVQPLIRS